ncbi:MAG: cyclic nucleotide-binding domain-containing protein [Solirubrobacteraceae bacterium]
MPTPADALRTVPFLAGVDDRDLADLAASMREREIGAGDDIVTQGTGGVAFFVILDGDATVTVNGSERRTLHAGEHFGEVALVAPDLPRTSTVTAKTDVRVAGLTAWKFKPFVLEHPEVAWSLLETLARRLADAPGA